MSRREDSTDNDQKIGIPALLRAMEEESFASNEESFASNYDKRNIVIAWLQQPGNNLKTTDLKEILGSIQDDDAKGNILVAWLQKPRNNLKFSELEKILGSIQDDDAKGNILVAWIQKAGNILKFPELEKILGSIKDDHDKRDILIAWLKKEGNNLEFTDLKEILKPIQNNYDQSNILLTWLQHEKNKPTTSQDLVRILNELPDIKYHVDIASKLYTYSGLPSEQIADFCHKLYPNIDWVKVELFKEFKDAVVGNEANKISLISSFLSRISDDDLALDVINHYRDRLKNHEILKIAKGRVNNQYQTIAELLKGKKIDENSLTKDGLANVTKIFPNITSDELKQFSLSDLLSYYLVQNSVAEFATLLKDEVKAEIKEQFKLSDRQVTLTPQEYNNILVLFGYNIKSDNLPEKIKLLKLDALCDYFKGKLPQITLDKDNLVITNPTGSRTTININEYQIRFSEDSPLFNDKDKQIVLNQKFQRLLKGDYSITEEKERENKGKDEAEEDKPIVPQPKEDVVINFLAEVLTMPDLPTATNSENKTKLLEFFEREKAQLAYLFSQENGVKDFAAIIVTLADGCVHNIGTQFNLALYQILLKDQPLPVRILYRLFNQEIIIPILNRGGDVIGIDSKPLDNKVVREQFLSPLGLVAMMIGREDKKEEKNEVKEGEVKEREVKERGVKLEQAAADSLSLVSSPQRSEGAEKSHRGKLEIREVLEIIAEISEENNTWPKVINEGDDDQTRNAKRKFNEDVKGKLIDPDVTTQKQLDKIAAHYILAVTQPSIVAHPTLADFRQASDLNEPSLTASNPSVAKLDNSAERTL